MTTVCNHREGNRCALCMGDGRPMKILAPISIGELIDKITILKIKMDRLDDPDKRANVLRELAELVETRENGFISKDLEGPLMAINETLWSIEDAIRVYEKRKDFGSGFIELARLVYQTNDRRSALKRQINEAFGSEIVEEKQYAG